jgi:3-dehydroquinate dehydratase
MPMDALRMSQIREALDADKIVQGKSFDIVKRWVSTQQEEPVEYQQLNEEDINTAGELVSAFQELLEKKLAEVSHRIRNNSGEPPASDSEIGLVEDVVNAYNRIISIVINPGNTQQTKEALHTTLMKSEATIKRLEILLEHVLNRMADTYSVAILKPGFGVFLKAYNVYNLMSKQLTSHSLVVITAGDLKANLMAILSGRRRWRRIMREHGISEPDYEPLEPGGPPGGGPPGGWPGGGPGGGWPGGGPSGPGNQRGPGPSGGPFGNNGALPDPLDWLQDDEENEIPRQPPRPYTAPNITAPSDESGIRPTTLGPTAQAPGEPVAAAPEGVVAQPQSFDMAADDADDITRLIDRTRLRRVEMERDALASRIEMQQRHQQELQEELRRRAEAHEQDVHRLIAEQGQIISYRDLPNAPAPPQEQALQDRFAQRMGQPHDPAALQDQMAQAAMQAAPEAAAEVRSSLSHLASDITSWTSHKFIPLLQKSASQGVGVSLEIGARTVTLSIETVNYLLKNPWIIQASMLGAYRNGTFTGISTSFLPDSLRVMLHWGGLAHFGMLNLQWSVQGIKQIREFVDALTNDGRRALPGGEASLTTGARAWSVVRGVENTLYAMRSQHQHRAEDAAVQREGEEILRQQRAAQPGQTQTLTEAERRNQTLHTGEPAPEPASSGLGPGPADELAPAPAPARAQEQGRAWAWPFSSPEALAPRVDRPPVGSVNGPHMQPGQGVPSAFGGLPRHSEHPEAASSIFNPRAQPPAPNIFDPSFTPPPFDPSLAESHYQLDRRSGAGRKAKRSKKNMSPAMKPRIGVPDPVLPHNDVSNDPYLIKSHHNSIVE